MNQRAIEPDAITGVQLLYDKLCASGCGCRYVDVVNRWKPRPMRRRVVRQAAEHSGQVQSTESFLVIAKLYADVEIGVRTVRSGSRTLRIIAMIAYLVCQETVADVRVIELRGDSTPRG